MSAWGNSWGQAWGNSWGVGLTPTPETGGGGNSFRRRLRVKRKPEDVSALIRQEISNRIESIRSDSRQETVANPASFVADSTTYELDLKGITQSEIDAEIARLLHKKMRTEEDEIILLLIMVAIIA